MRIALDSLENHGRFLINLLAVSRKIDAFRLLIQQPLTKRDFLLFIPAIVQASILAQAVTFPTEQLQSVEVYKQGQKIELPTKFETGGDWSFDIPDSTLTLIRYNLLDVLYNKQIFDVYFFLGNILNSINLGGLTSIQSILSNAFSYLTTAQKLGGCWIRSISPVEFSQSDPETPILWRVLVHYNYIRPVIDLGINLNVGNIKI